MKLSSTTAAVEYSGDLAPPTQARIVAGPKAFEILSSSLYTDKPLAIVRELGCNATDAHAEAGCPDRPWDLQLPNRLKPELRVRDYGPGLPDDKMKSVYVDYFDSTKATSDLYVGAFGLGAKSPLSYCKGCQVVSFQKGVRRTYAYGIGASNTPEITLMATTETDEPDGLEVAIPVRGDDIHRFVTAAGKAFRFFPVRPNVTGARVDYEEPKYKVKTEFAGLPQYGDSLVVMGGVAYPLDLAALAASSDLPPGADATAWTYPELFKADPWMSRNCVHLFVPIGTVEPTASREALSYTANTITALRQHLERASEAMCARMFELVAQAPTLWHARTRVASFAGIRVDASLWAWRGQPVKTSFEWTEVVPQPLWGFRARAYDLTYSKPKRGKNKHTRRLRRFAFPSSFSVKNDEPAAVFVNDVASANLFARCEDWLQENVVSSPGFSEDSVSAVLIPTELNTPEVLEAFGFVGKTVLLSSVPKRKPKPKDPKPRIDKTVFQAINHDGRLMPPYADIDVAAGGFFVESCRDSLYRTVHGKRVLLTPYEHAAQRNGGYKPDAVLAALGQLLGRKLTGSPVFAVRTADTEKVKKSGPWVELDAAVVAALAVNRKRLAARLSKAAAYARFSVHHENVLFSLQLPKTSPMRQYVAAYKAAAKAAHDPAVRAYRQLHAHFVGDTEPTTQAWPALQAYYEEAVKRYPLAFFYDTNNYIKPSPSANEIRRALVRYVHEVDATTRKTRRPGGKRLRVVASAAG